MPKGKKLKHQLLKMSMTTGLNLPEPLWVLPPVVETKNQVKD